MSDDCSINKALVFYSGLAYILALVLFLQGFGGLSDGSVNIPGFVSGA